jgi:hypothetical protein
MQTTVHGLRDCVDKERLARNELCSNIRDDGNDLHPLIFPLRLNVARTKLSLKLLNRSAFRFDASEKRPIPVKCAYNDRHVQILEGGHSKINITILATRSPGNKTGRNRSTRA